MSVKPQIGLVLSGGGAKGAFHVGVLQAIDELQIPIHGVAGASIGALNGAIVASADNMHEAYLNLLEIWQTLANDHPISGSPQGAAYLTMLVGAGLAFRINPVLTSGATFVNYLAEKMGFEISEPEAHILDDTPLTTLLAKHITPQKLKNGLPLYVSVYPSNGAFSDIAGALLASLGITNTRNSEFMHIQTLPDNEMQQALMASAALPLLFRSRKISGKRYTDGGQGDWFGVSGNTPADPIADAGYQTIIVVHLSDGSQWDRNRYPNCNIIEIRPRASIARGNAGGDLLGFDHERINSWIEQGYTDAKHCLERVFKTLAIHNELTASSQALQASMLQNSEYNNKLDAALARMKQSTQHLNKTQ